jgi:CheY-like chemotaxis protein/HPt (histidine-containing phosphotransfer) domain-containing protein
MTAVRVLHVDDEPDIREIVEMSLALDPDLTVRGCASGGDALAAAAAWSPDLILLDVMMPVMDGPTTLTHLRQSPRTADIPVVFMTARAQPRELEHFVSLGAEGVIAKPFDPMTLAAAVRNYVGGLAAGIAARRMSFLERAREQAKALAREREALADPATKPAALDRIGTIAHRTAGGSGIFGLVAMSREAAELEAAVNAELRGGHSAVDVEHGISALIARIEQT